MIIFKLCFIVQGTAVCVQKRCSQNVAAVAGSVVSFRCTLDVNCSTERVRWVHNSPSYVVEYDIWYKEGTYDPFVKSRGITVDDNPTQRWSVLKIPGVRLTDHGRFQCLVVDTPCGMNFQLSVIGNNCIVLM